MVQISELARATLKFPSWLSYLAQASFPSELKLACDKVSQMIAHFRNINSDRFSRTFMEVRGLICQGWATQLSSAILFVKGWVGAGLVSHDKGSEWNWLLFAHLSHWLCGPHLTKSTGFSLLKVDWWANSNQFHSGPLHNRSAFQRFGVISFRILEGMWGMMTSQHVMIH